MTLTEFLLARIAEDEAAVQMDANGFFAELSIVNKMLAECEAKRRIVQIAEAPRQDLEVLPDLANFLLGYTQAFHDAMLELAEPYADHPNYQQEWNR